MGLEGRAALVTGGNRGIGAGIAICLAEQGADVAISYLDGDDEAAAIVRRIHGMGRRPFIRAGDLRNPLEPAALVGAVIAEFGTIDILVNNAGIGVFRPFLDTTLQEWTDTIDTNLRAAFLCSQAAASHMASRRFGRIIHITSTGSIVAIPGLSHYCASKAALAMLAKTMAVELGPFGITVNAVGPSTIRTQLNELVLAADNMEAREAALNPTRRIGVPADIAATVAFLASDEAAWLNGQNIIVDGGLTAMSAQPAYTVMG